MTIHHATLAKANKAGMVLSDDPKTFVEFNGKTAPKDTVRAHYPKYNLIAYGIGAPAAFEQMAATVRIKTHDDSRIIVRNEYDPFEIAVFNHDRTLAPYRGYAIPTDAYNAIAILDQSKKPWLTTKVPDNGAEAHKQGFTADDNPFRGDEDDDASTEKADAWDAEFDEAIEADEEPEDAGGSVVKEVYRIRYAEAGHPNHCGDWMAQTHNNFVIGKAQTDLDVFERICNENGVSLAKYKREGNGWQGRLRMTGRNLLSRVVYANDGLLKLPAGLVEGTTELRAPSEWMAEQNYKVKKNKGPAESSSTPVPAAPEPTSSPEVAPEQPLSRAEMLKKHRASKGK